MAPARRVAEPQLRGLQFSEFLSWKPSKPIPAKTLIERLDTLGKELKTLDQDDTDTHSLEKVAKELAGHNLLGHRDRGVKAFAACCLVDILRLCAPVAPLSASQLKEVFTCLIADIIPLLSDPGHAYNVQHMYVLNSLSEVKSILLVTDLPQSESLVLKLFENSFNVLLTSAKSSSGEQIGQKVLNDLTGLLICLVDEMQTLPDKAIELLVGIFLIPKALSQSKDDTAVDAKQSTLIAKELPPAYNTVKTICEVCTAKMTRYISQYFNSEMMDVSDGARGTKRKNHKPKQLDDSDDEDDATEQDLGNLEKAHQLVREVWRACPNVLQNVIPQLEAELLVPDVQIRLLAVQTLGDIVSGIGSAGPPPPPTMDPSAYPPVMLADVDDSQVRMNPLTTPLSPQSFAQTHNGAYQNFLGRQSDKSAIIRAAWTTAIGRIILTSAGGIGLGREDEAQLVKSLEKMLVDFDERVRLAAVKVVAGFGLREIMDKFATTGSVTTANSVLGILADRVKDLKPLIRTEAMTTLARIWGVAAAEIAAGNELVTTTFGGIPSRIFESYYANTTDLHVLLERVLFEQLVPLNFPPSKIKSATSNESQSQGGTQSSNENAVDPDKIRTERILLLVRSLSEKSMKSFFAVQRSQTQHSKVMDAFLKKCEEYNGGVGYEENIDKKLGLLIEYFSALLPDPPRASADLWRFAKMHDRRTYVLLRFMKNPGSDYNTVHKSIKEFRKRIETEKGAPAGLLETLDPLIYKTSLLLYNRSHLPAIVQFSKTDEKGMGNTAHEILADISQNSPDIFKVHVKELCKTLEEQTPTSKKSNDLDSVKTLKACAGFARKYPKEMPNDRKFIQTLLAFAQYGSPPQAAKYAVIILMQATDRKEMHARDLLQKVTTDWTYGSDHFLTKMATISQLVLLASEEARDTSDEILDIAIQKVLLNVRTEASEENKKWQGDSEIDEECQAKCWALKILVNNLRAIEDDDEAKELSEPVFQMLNLVISQEGEISKKKDTPISHKCRLRLVAAQQLLKLCTIRRYLELFKPTDFIKLACIAQDSVFDVRRGFVNKLLKYLSRGALSYSFYPIVFLLAFEPEKSYREMAATWIRSRYKFFHDKTPPETTLENCFVRLLSLLAHHPDFSTEPEDLEDHARYILFYITTVVNKENLGLVYRYAERLKQTRDAIDPSSSDNLYILSELAQSLLRKYAEKKSWAMQAYPSKLRLPAKIFVALPGHAAAQAIADKQYLPDSFEENVERLIRDLDKRKKRKSTIDDGSQPSKKIKTERTKVNKEPSVRKTKAPSKPKTPKVARTSDVPESARRRSGRGAIAKDGVKYADRDSDEDDEEMWNGVAKWEYLNGEKPEDNEDEPASDSDDGDPLITSDGQDDVEMPDAEDPEPEEPSEMEAEPETASTPATAKVNGKANGKRSAKNTPSSKTKPPPRAKKVSPVAEPETNGDAETEEGEDSPAPVPVKANGKRTASKKSSEKTPTSASKLPTRSSRRVASVPSPEPEAAEPDEGEESAPSDAEAEEEAEVPVPKTNGKAKKGGKGKASAKESPKQKESKVPEPRSRAKRGGAAPSSSQPKEAAASASKGKAKGKGKAKAKEKDIFDMESD